MLPVISRPVAAAKIVMKIQEIIDSVSRVKNPERKKRKPGLTNIQKIKLIEETLEREIRPALEKDGGDIELIDVDGNAVYVQAYAVHAPLVDYPK